MTNPITKLVSALAVSVAVLTLVPLAPAHAADMNGKGRGSMKDRANGAVPVPAPAPYEEHYKYYMGAGFGYTFAASGDVSLSAGGVAGGLPIGGIGDLNGPFVMSVFAGRYITPTLRTEIGLDLRTTQKRARAYNYAASLGGTMDFGTPAAPNVQTVYNNYAVTRTEDIEHRNNTLMFNLYYDMNRGGRFNPYVGAGLGISQLHLARGTTEIARCLDGGLHPVTGAANGCWAGASPALPTGLSPALSRTDAETGIGLAASLMAGFTYNLSERTHLDVGYRLMFQGGHAAVTARSLGPCSAGCSGTGVSILDVGSRVDHEIRTGIRWDLW